MPCNIETAGLSAVLLTLIACRKVQKQLLTWCSIAPQCNERVVSLAAKVIGAQKAFLDIVQHLAMHSIRRPFPLQLEYQHATAEEANAICRMQPCMYAVMFAVYCSYTHDG